MSTTVNDKALISNTRDCTKDETLLVHINGGDNIFHQQGDLNIVPMSDHYEPSFLANILSMKDVQNIPGIRITMDTLEESAMLIQLFDGNVLEFQECNYGICYYNMAQWADIKNKKTKYNSSVTNYYPNPSSQYLVTVKYNKDFFTKRYIERANSYRKLQEYIGCIDILL